MLKSLHYDEPGHQQRETDSDAIDALLAAVTSGLDDDVINWMDSDGNHRFRVRLWVEGQCRPCNDNGQTPVQQASEVLLEDLLSRVVDCLKVGPLYVPLMEVVLQEWLSVPDAMERRARRVMVTDALART